MPTSTCFSNTVGKKNMENISILYCLLLEDKGALVDHYFLQHEDVKVDRVEHTLAYRVDRGP